MPPLLSRLISHLRPAIEGYEHPAVVEAMYRRTTAARIRTDYTFAGAFTVLDYGGGFGIHHKQAYHNNIIKWAIVETPKVCERASYGFTTPGLSWFPSISLAAAWLGPIDLIHCNGALQYSNQPCQDMIDLVALRAKRILWRRMVFSSDNHYEHDTQTSYLCDNGPQGTPYLGPHLRVRYPITRLPKKLFMQEHALHYTLTSCTADSFDFSLKETP